MLKFSKLKKIYIGACLSSVKNPILHFFFKIETKIHQRAIQLFAWTVNSEIIIYYTPLNLTKIICINDTGISG